MTVIKLDAVD